VAIVTGGASGIGAATVVGLRDRGLRVAVFDLAGGEGVVPVDVADHGAVEAAVADVRAELGPVEVLVNAAGIAAGGAVDGDDYVAEWDRAIAVNLTGTMLMVRSCMGDLRASGHGRIVNIASTEGLGATRGTGPYSVSKHGVVGFTRSLAVDHGREGVTANCVCPGSTLTGLTRQIPEERREGFARRKVPVGRYAAPEEIAYMVVALTALEATYVNGAIIPVDGGLTAKGD
jgi:3-oxoacyl-[acyl-carrier protein] reductase